MLFNFFLGQRADQLVDQLAVLEQKHRGNILNAVLRSDQGIFVHIELGNFDTTRILVGQFIENGRDRAAGAAPGGPTIHQNRPGRRNDLLGEGGVRHIHRMRLITLDDKRFAALSATGPVMETVLRHPVFSPATEAADNHFIQRRFALTARRLVLKVLPGNAIFGSAVQAADNDLF